MRWHFVDRIERFEPWRLAVGIKGVSLEEHSLLERFGRPGVLPQALALESCAQLSRWLAIASSQFEKTCVATAMNDVHFSREARMGEMLTLQVTVAERAARSFAVDATVACAGEAIATGRLDLTLMPLSGFVDPAAALSLWRGLHGKT